MFLVQYLISRQRQLQSKEEKQTGIFGDETSEERKIFNVMSFKNRLTAIHTSTAGRIQTDYLNNKFNKHKEEKQKPTLKSYPAM